MARAMEPDKFGQQIQLAQNRFDQLRDQLATFAWLQDEIAIQLVEELSIALGELHVAAEQMQERHECLIDDKSVLEADKSVLEAERQRYQDLFEFAPHGYLVTDIVGRIQEVNRAALLVLGLPRDRLFDTFLLLFIPFEERKVFRGKLNQIQATLQPIQDWECHIQQPDGTQISCELTATAIFHPQSYAIGFRWLIRDVSERRRIIEMETASRVKDQFLGIVSHELRSPLNPILGWACLLRSGKVSQKQTVHAIEVIERNAKLQSQLIENLLDVSRILRGKLSLNPYPVDLVTTIRSAIETVQLAADAKRIEISFIIGQAESEQDARQNQGNESNLPNSTSLSDCRVLGDAARLQQVLWNLLSNAIKFTPEGDRIEVKLSLVTNHESSGTTAEPIIQVQSTDQQTQPQVTHCAQITISDNGKGISAEFLPHVFEYFRQADSSTTRQFSGLGLGLAIVRHILELHGGTVQADSSGEGQGATFTIKLPLLQPSPE